MSISVLVEIVTVLQTYKFFIYYIECLMLILGYFYFNKNAKDWISGTEMSLTNCIEERNNIHHIFPQVYCEQQNYDKKKWNSIINQTSIFFSNNRYIGGIYTSKYIDKIIKNRVLSEEQFLNYV